MIMLIQNKYKSCHIVYFIQYCKYFIIHHHWFKQRETRKKYKSINSTEQAAVPLLLNFFLFQVETLRPFQRMSLGVDHTCQFDESLLYIGVLLHRRSDILQLVLSTEDEDLLFVNFLFQICLITDQHYRRLFGFLSQERQPLWLDILKRRGLWKVKDEHDAVTAFEICWDDASVALLSRSVPDE